MDVLIASPSPLSALPTCWSGRWRWPRPLHLLSYQGRTEDRTEVRAAERPGSGLGALGQRSRSRLKARTTVRGEEGPSPAGVSMSSVDGGAAFKVGLTVAGEGGGGGGGLSQPTEEAQQEAQELRAEA